MTRPLQTTVADAAQQALAAWLQRALGEEVKVFAAWASTAALRNPTVSIIRAGQPRDEMLQPTVCGEEVIHAAITPRIVPTLAVVDVATAISALNLARASYEAHRIDVAAHASADTVNAITAPAATDQTSAEALADELRQLGAIHVESDAHTTPDGNNLLAAADAVTPGDVTSLVTLTKKIVQALSAHYVAQIYIWQISDIRQPMQIDVWTATEPRRNDIEARLVKALNTSTLDGGDPVQNGCLVQLGNGWVGTADFVFDTPRLSQTADAVQKSEFRLTYSGYADYSLQVKAQSPRMATLTLQAALASTPLPVTSAPKIGSVSTDGTTTTTAYSGS